MFPQHIRDEHLSVKQAGPVVRFEVMYFFLLKKKGLFSAKRQPIKLFKSDVNKEEEEVKTCCSKVEFKKIR